MLKIYSAGAMTGLTGEELVERSQHTVQVLYSYGIECLDPVLAEGVKPTKKKVLATPEQMKRYWKRDKQLVRQAHCVFDLTPDKKSEGTAHELGYARYHLWKKVIRVYPEGKLPPPGLVPWLEDDYVTDSLEDACEEALRTHGTYVKRLKWRTKLHARCWFKAKYYRLLEWCH